MQNVQDVVALEFAKHAQQISSLYQSTARIDAHVSNFVIIEKKMEENARNQDRLERRMGEMEVKLEESERKCKKLECDLRESKEEIVTLRHQIARGQSDTREEIANGNDALARALNVTFENKFTELNNLVQSELLSGNSSNQHVPVNTSASYVNSVVAESDLAVERLKRRVDEIEERAERREKTAGSNMFVTSDAMDQLRESLLAEISKVEMDAAQFRVEREVNKQFDKENNVYGWMENHESTHRLSTTDKNSLLDEIGISRPDRSEVEKMLMTRIEPIAETVRSLQMGLGEVDREVRGIAPVPKGLVNQEMLAETVNNAVKMALTADGGRVSHAHLTTALESSREGLLRNIEGQVGKARSEVLDLLSSEVGGTKEGLYEAVTELRSRLDDLEHLTARSNAEIVATLNKKCYKADVVKALSDKADKNYTLNALRLKADTTKVENDLATGVKELVSRIQKNDGYIGNLSREFYELKDEVKREQTKMGEWLKRKVDVDEIESLKIGIEDGRDWRTSLGEVSLNLRRELAAKCNREEMISTIRKEVDGLIGQVDSITGDLGEMAGKKTVNLIEGEVESLNRRFAESHTGGRWLWRSGKILQGGLIPLEVQVTNAAPQSLLWNQDNEYITCTNPGLYEVDCGIFTCECVKVELIVNSEAVITLDPGSGSRDGSGNGSSDKSNNGGGWGGGGGGEHVKRRNRHSAGDITCVRISEVVALPSNAHVSIRYDSKNRAQGFLSLRKM